MNLIDNLFKLTANRTNFRRECLAGMTTFFTMAYIIFVNPVILGSTGMDWQAVFVATCLVAAIGSLLTGVMSNYPIAVAPGMALNSYFAYVVVQGLGYSWQTALGAVFISGIIFFILTLTRIRNWIVEAIPENINIGLSVGIGIFIMLLALKNIGMINSDPDIFITLGQVQHTIALLFILGLCLIFAFDRLKIPGSIILSILTITIVSVVLGINKFQGVYSLPPSILPTFFALNVSNILNLSGLTVIFSFVLVALFDATGTLIGLLAQPKLIKNPEKEKRLFYALMADSIATIMGALLGTSSTSPFIESAAGIRAGGRTGLTPVIVAALFLLALFFSPLAATVPNYAASAALFYIGLLIIKNVVALNIHDYSEFIPSVVTLTLIPLTFSIADGLGWGILSYIMIKIILGKARSLNYMLLTLGIIFVVYLSLQ
ncbi:MAG: guanine permease [Gammaproteobacteria bacterium RIFCSPHIGHO2_12_FULL_37_14]|nr:MAG: guanine permease [Gammaproteobacteria bacterium RIFCSPHIGHO2_12_FULL_37_14]